MLKLLLNDDLEVDGKQSKGSSSVDNDSTKDASVYSEDTKAKHSRFVANRYTSIDTDDEAVATSEIVDSTHNNNDSNETRELIGEKHVCNSKNCSDNDCDENGRILLSCNNDNNDDDCSISNVNVENVHTFSGNCDGRIEAHNANKMDGVILTNESKTNDGMNECYIYIQ